MRSMSSASSPSGVQAVRLARLPDRVPQRRTVVRVAPQLVAEFAGVPGARDQQRDAVVVARAGRSANRNQFSSAKAVCVGGVQTSSLSSSRLRGPWTARLCSWSVDRLTQTRFRPSRSRLLAQPQPVVLVAADEPEVGVAQPEHGGSRRSSRRSRCTSPSTRPGRCDSLRMLRVTQACSSASASGPSTSNLRSGDRSISAARSRHAQYSSSRAVVVEGGRQPVAPVFGELPGELRRPGVKAGFLGQLCFGLGR